VTDDSFCDTGKHHNSQNPIFHFSAASILSPLEQLQLVSLLIDFAISLLLPPKRKETFAPGESLAYLFVYNIKFTLHGESTMGPMGCHSPVD
jgi:hypothetical protein